MSCLDGEIYFVLSSSFCASLRVMNLKKKSLNTIQKPHPGHIVFLVDLGDVTSVCTQQVHIWLAVSSDCILCL